MFGLENDIKQWKTGLRKNPAFEDGDIEELESHLRDRIQQLRAEGSSEKEAFSKAAEEIGNPYRLGEEIGKVKKKRNSLIDIRFLNIGLFYNYLNVSLRGLKRNKGFSIINILGLSVGIWACLAIYLVIQDDLSFDRFHENADQIYRIENELRLASTGEIEHWTRVPITWAGAIKEEIPEVKEAGRMAASGGDIMVRIENQAFKESEFIYVDNEIFKIFTLPILSGNNKTPLKRPNTVVLTKSFAQKYFGNENPIGKTLIAEVNWYGSVEYEVTAVIEDLPKNSHFRQCILFSFPTLANQLFADINQNRTIHFYYTYLLLEAGTDIDVLDKKLDQFVAGHYEKERAGRYNPELIGLTDIYLHAKGDAQLGSTNNVKYVYIQAVIALLILLIAVFNFVNLSTAQSIDRAKEVGVRKVLGADRSSLIRQYLSESIVYCFVATLIALGLLYATLSYINSLSGKLLALGGPQLLALIPKLFAGVLVVGVLAGLYPSVFLSSFRPSDVFKGWSSSGNSTRWLRKVLVGFQFSFSVFLIFATLVVYKQLNFLKERDIGIDKEQVVGIDLLSREVAANYSLLKNRLLQINVVTNVSASVGFPRKELYYSSYRFEDTPERPQNHEMGRQHIDKNFFKTMGISLLAGDVPEAFDSDSSGYFVINEAAAHQVGWEDPQEAVGKRISYTRPNEQVLTGTIVAVSENFHLESPHQRVEPVVMDYWNEGFAQLHVRFAGGLAGSMELIEQAYREVYPNLPYEFTFLKDRIAGIYVGEDKMGRLFYLFSMIAILIACMGLFGIAAYAVDRRTKEIGIRKVLGADSMQIMNLLSKNFMKLVAAAFLVASPLAWYTMHQWLNNYTYRIEVGVSLFIFTGSLILLIALVTISWHSVRAALMDPVKSLKSE